jgi:hypothetical protein
MDINVIISRAKNLILSPASEWEVIKTEAKPSNDILVNYAIPFVVLVGVCKIVGSLLFHMSYFNLTSSFLSAIIAIVVPLGTLYFSAWIISELAGSFGSQKNFDAAFRLTAYAFTASYIASAAAGLIPLIGISTIFSLCGLYSFYILYTGFTPMMATPEDKKAGYFLISLLVIIVAMVIFSMVLTLILTGSSTGMSMMK